jgi:hypothetical protein
VGLVLRCACDGEDGLRYEARVIDHGNMSDPGQYLNVAWGRRSGSALAYSTMGSTASFSDHATVIGYGNGV